MPNAAKVRVQRLRKTKAQLIDEIDTLEQRAAAIEATYRSGAPMRAKTADHYLANQGLVHLARFPSENPNPILRVLPDGTVLYANDAASAVKGLSARASVMMRSKTFEALEKRGMIFQGSTDYDCSLTEKGRRAFEAI